LEHRVLGRTGVRVSAIGVGTWQLSGPLDLGGRPDGYPDPGREAVIRLVRECGDLGCNLIDTAAVYGDGEGERRVGEALRGSRERWVIVTKFGLRRGSRGERIEDAGAATIRPSLEGSLARLGTDHVDVLLFHVPPAFREARACAAVLEALKSEGKLRFWGISTGDPLAVRDLVALGAADVVMLPRSLLTEPAGALRTARRHGLGVIARGVFAGGRLTGRYLGGASFPDSDIRRRALAGEDLGRFRVYQDLLPEGFTLADLALRHVLDADLTHAVVLGARSIEDYRSAVGTLSLPRLSPAVVRRIVALRSELRPARQSLRQVTRAVVRRMQRIGRALRRP
jgi:aryl-alcohol dehydrogenase-like predicted oxidoreductase